MSTSNTLVEPTLVEPVALDRKSGRVKPGETHTGISESIQQSEAESSPASHVQGSSLEMLTAVLDTLPQPVFWKDRDSVFMGCNAAFAAEVGCNPQDIAGKNDFDFNPKSLAKAFRADDKKVIESGLPFLEKELKLKGKDGLKRYESVSRMPLKDRQGNTIGVLGTFRDITDQRLTEKALKASQEQCSSTFNRSASGIALLDVSDGDWLRVNQALCDMLGYSEEELLGKTYKELTHPDDLETNLEMVDRLLAGEKCTDRWEKRYIHKNGQSVWALVSASLVRDADDKPLYFISQIQDITELKQAQQTLKESDERLRILFEFAPDAYFLMDFDGVLFGGNKAVETLTGTDRMDFYKKNFLEANLLSEADAKKAKEALTRVAAGQPSGSVEYTLFRKDGTEVPVEVSSYPMSIQGRPVILSIARDISERKEAEQELSRMQGRLLEYTRQAGMAEVATSVLHNVGNVLNSINVSSSLVAEKVRTSQISGLSKVATLLKTQEDDLASFFADDPRGQKLPGFMARLSAYLEDEQREIIDELDFLGQDIEHVKEIVSMQQAYTGVSGAKDVVDIREMMEDSVRMHKRALERHKVEVVRDFDSAPSLELDKYKIMQILVNLIHNAKYACSESQRDDRKMTLRVRSDKDHIRISVIDNGIGIAPEEQEQIFNYGFTTRKGGHGFGLYSGMLAAEELGGSLSVHSEGLGHGTTFTLELPGAKGECSHE